MPGSPTSAGKNTPVEIIGRMAGEYRLRRKLGEGGFGAVYEAEHPVLKRMAAVKVLHQAAGRDSEAVLRFISEAQAANQIRSRNIVDVFSFGKLPDGRHFYVMDLLEGEPLDRCLAREIRFPVPVALQLLRPIAEALDAAHAAGVVHRDLKPQNVFLTWDQNGETVPKLLDFGMAKLLGDSPVRTLSGTPMGTPLYMSPEQARGEKVDGRSDVYALGVLAHELLTGRLPLTGDSTIVVLMAHILQPPPRMSEVCPDLPAILDEPILRMLDKDPRARPAAAGAALSALLDAAERAGLSAPPGLPRLPRPSMADAGAAEGRAGMGIEALETSPTDPDEDDGGPEPGASESEGLASSSSRRSAPELRAAERRARARWGILGGIVTLGLVVAYLVGGRMNATDSPRPPVSASSLSPSHSVSPAAFSPSASPPVRATSPPPVSGPGSVALTVEGAPRGARILVDGKPAGDTPGPVDLPFGAAPLRLSITATGYETATLTLIPDRPRTLTVKLSRKRADGPHPRAPIPSDLESPF